MLMLDDILAIEDDAEILSWSIVEGRGKEREKPPYARSTLW